MPEAIANGAKVPSYIKIAAKATQGLNVAKNGVALAEYRHTPSDCRNLNKNSWVPYPLIAHFFSILRHCGFGARRALLRTSISMDALSTIAASGMTSRMQSLDMLANNISNAETGGYKTDREFYSLYTSPEAMSADAQDPATLPMIEKSYTDFSQGSMHVTSNPLDLAVQGQGFFAVSTPAGTAYTRNGAFQISSGGNLVTSDGFNVLDPSGQPIQLSPSVPIQVTGDGTITQGGQTAGQLALWNFADPGNLVKQGNTMFRNTDPNVNPTPSTAQVQQGKLESSNVGTSESAVRLVSVMRSFEMLQKAVNIGAEMNRQSITEVAKVGS
jgi:flagellar basal-body rod protein FlgF